MQWIELGALHCMHGLDANVRLLSIYYHYQFDNDRLLIPNIQSAAVLILAAIKKYVDVR